MNGKVLLFFSLQDGARVRVKKVRGIVPLTSILSRGGERKFKPNGAAALVQQIPLSLERLCRNVIAKERSD